MDITWYGHSCFSVLSGGETVVLDPFTGVDGCPDTAASAQRCLCSHEHFDHAFRQGVRLIPGPRAISVSRVETFHDDCQGALRGKNTVHILEAEGLRVVHLGDLGHPLTPRQREAIGRPDVLLLPVGGTYTVGPEAAWSIARELKARAVVPMHYRTGRFGFPQLADVESFLALCPPEEILRLPDRTWRVSVSGTRKIVVFPAKFQEAEK